MSDDRLHLEKLPAHIVEQIFGYLPFTEIARVSVVSQFFLKTGDRMIRKSFFSLHLEIGRELIRLKEELDGIPRTSDYIQERIPYLRSYYILERHLSELSIMKAVWRGIIYDKARCSICIAKLLQEFTAAVAAAKRRNLPQWNISNEIEIKINRISKVYLEYKLSDIQLDYLFGCRIIDVMDSFINKHYEINVKYYVDDNSCAIHCLYKLQSPHVLQLPPKLAEPSERVPSLEDRRKLYMYLINLVRINNRVTLREEQYQRERALDSNSNWSLLEEDTGEREDWGTSDVRIYHLVLPNPQREERVIDGKYIFEETYHSTQAPRSASSPEKKFSCEIHVECPLSEAPLSIMDSWKRIRDEIICTRYNDTELLRQISSVHAFSEQSENSNIESHGDYSCECTFEIKVNHSAEVQRLILRDP